MFILWIYILLGSLSAVWVFSFQGALSQQALKTDQMRVMAAKQALLAWSITRFDDKNTSEAKDRPGEFPCPDVGNFGYPPGVLGYAGGTCTGGKIKGLPWYSLGITQLLDTKNRAVQYTLDHAYRRITGSNTLILNPSITPSLTIEGQKAVAWVGIEGGSLAAGTLQPIYAKELWPPIERRAGIAVADALYRYFSLHQMFPAPANPNDPACLDDNRLTECVSELGRCEGILKMTLQPFDNTILQDFPLPYWFYNNFWNRQILYAVSGSAMGNACPSLLNAQGETVDIRFEVLGFGQWQMSAIRQNGGLVWRILKMA